MQRNYRKSGGTILAAAVVLFISGGCVNNDFAPRLAVTGVTVSRDGAPVTASGYIFLPPATEATFTATAIGDDSAAITWSIPQGAEHVELSAATGNTVTVTGVTTGIAKISVEAANDSGSKNIEFYIDVNMVGRNWNFGIFDGETPVDGSLNILPDGTKTITVTLFGEAGADSITWTNGNDSVITLSGTAGASVTVTAAALGISQITVAVVKGGHTITKMFTVTVGAIEVDPGFLFQWKSATTPMSGPFIVGNTIGSGYKDIDFRAVGNNIEIIDGAFRLGSNARLVIGATSGSGTGGTTHVEGVFDLSKRFRITLEWKDALVPGSDYLLRVYVNNNQTSQDSSVLGSNSNIGQYNNSGQLEVGTPQGGLKSGVTNTATPGKLIITVNPQTLYGSGVTSLSTAFVALISQGESRITVTGITIEEVK